jgi:hypothetical protein
VDGVVGGVQGTEVGHLADCQVPALHLSETCQTIHLSVASLLAFCIQSSFPEQRLVQSLFGLAESRNRRASS